MDSQPPGCGPWIQRLGREARPAHAVRGRGSARAARGEAAAGQQV